jgi:hypothetical protein
MQLRGPHLTRNRDDFGRRGLAASPATGRAAVARSSLHRDDTAAFHRDLAGPPVVDGIHASSGEDGTTSGLPGTRTKMEIVRAHRRSHPGAV